MNGPGKSIAGAGAGTLRVVSYNVRALRDDRAALVRVIRDLKPDLLCMQEAPRLLGWRLRLAALARDTRLLYVAGGGTTFGVALFSSLAVDVRTVREHRLTRTPGLHRRGAVTAEVHALDTRFAVAAVHLGLIAKERKRHASEIDDALAGHEVPEGIVAGDLNEQPDGPVFRSWAAKRVDCAGRDETPTFSTSAPRRRIDAVLAGSQLRPVRYQVVDNADVRAASDHRPVVVDFAVS